VVLPQQIGDLLWSERLPRFGQKCQNLVPLLTPLNLLRVAKEDPLCGERVPLECEILFLHVPGSDVELRVGAPVPSPED